MMDDRTFVVTGYAQPKPDTLKSGYRDPNRLGPNTYSVPGRQDTNKAPKPLKVSMDEKKIAKAIKD